MVTFALWVTRTELALPDLQLNADAYEVSRAGFQFSAVTKRRRTVSSPWIHGDVPVGPATREAQAGRVRVTVTAANVAAVEAAVEVVTAAFDQSEFEIHREVDGAHKAWQCYSADWNVGWTAQGYWEDSRVPVDFVVPYQPIELAV